MPNQAYAVPEPGIFVEGVFVPERLTKFGPVHYDAEDVWTCKDCGFKCISLGSTVRHLQEHQHPSDKSS